MCAIYKLSLKTEDRLMEKLINRYGDEVVYKYCDAELYPKDEAPVVGPGDKVALMKWGFPLSKKNSVVFNARAETLGEKALFKGCEGNHCIVPASSFFEWGEVGEKKQKFKIRTCGGVFYFAGLWKKFTGKDGAKEYCFTIITTEPNRQVATIHSRMPAIIAKGREREWLDAKSFESGLLVPYEENVRIDKAE